MFNLRIIGVPGFKILRGTLPELAILHKKSPTTTDLPYSKLTIYVNDLRYILFGEEGRRFIINKWR